jgi:Tfp pilus tip-associated adhesin PilY1
MWRFGNFTDSEGNSLDFPNSDENINNWTAQIILLADASHGRQFYYPPSVALERGYDLVFTGTGNREDACGASSADRIYALKDTHCASTLQESDLVDLTNPAATVPALDVTTQDVDGNGHVDQGWYLQLANGEKSLSEGTVFYKTYYVTTFTPNGDPCLPGGVGKLYALNYKTAQAVLDFGVGLSRCLEIGGGIPSKPVIAIRDTLQKLFASIGSTNPEASSESVAAGVLAIDPYFPTLNFFYLWWREL